ncbi:MAG: ATP-dependent Clp protease ATP-binding subunit [Patescibacteria group bacterium]
MSNILSKFSTHYQKILNWAITYAQSTGRQKLEVSDLILALASARGSLAAEILERHGLTPTTLREKLGSNPVSLLPAGTTKHFELQEILTTHLSEVTKKVIEKSVVAAWRYQHHYVGTEHLLEALVTENGEETTKLWQKLNINVINLKQSISSVLKSTSKFPDITEMFSPFDLKTEARDADNLQALEFFGTNLTSDEVQNKIDPVIGRAKEITRLINILARRTKNNPLLLGDPGVGKTAIVEGLAKRILAGQVPDWLMDKKIYALDLGLVIAGTMYRGEFESRMKQIIDEMKTNPDLILFIDEIHTIVGTGSAPGSLDLANLLKPALAKGYIRCIGATTQEEYKKNIESDPALERRFQTLTVKEVSLEEAKQVLMGIKANYEKFHNVTIVEEIIDQTLYLAERYLPDKFLPDKAIDILDEASSNLRTQITPSPEFKQQKELNTKLKQLTEAKELAIDEENFILATQYKEEETKVETELTKLTEQIQRQKIPANKLTRQDIATVVSQMTGVEITELLDNEKSKLTQLEQIIGKYLKGQNEAVTTVSRFIRRGRLGIASSTKPVGSFMFLGPSGVGKTELAKILAREVFGDENSLIRLDMSEFAEAFNISKLIGAPAGYIGYKDSNKLTDQVKRHPASVVLFDEIEKAHADVFNLLLQILDEGHLTDAAGKQINFKNCLIILTSNLGLKELNQQATIGFEADSEGAKKKFIDRFAATKATILAEVKKFFRPEFLNRLDAVLVFNPLAEKDLEEIVKLQLQELDERIKQQKLPVKIKLGRGAARVIAKKTWTPDQGARGIRRFIQEQIENFISDKLLSGNKEKSITVAINAKGKEVVVE